MKQMTCISALIVCLSCSLHLLGQDLSIMSYNIRYATVHDGENAWSKRKADVAALVNYYGPEVLGVQEALHEQMEFLDSALESYTFVGVGRDDAVTSGEYSAIFYDSTRLRGLSTLTFWLSETPTEPSFGWGANHRRICTYGSFMDKATGDTIHVFNAHFDHEVELARLNSAQVILEKVKELGLLDERIVLTGDFNCLSSDPPMKRLSTLFNLSSRRTRKPAYGPKSTFSGFEKRLSPNRTLDHIMTRNLEVDSYRHIDDRRPNGLWPSDHLPVLTTVH